MALVNRDKMSFTEFDSLCGRVECLSARVTHQLIRVYPELDKFRKELNSFQDELVELIRDLPDEREERISREQQRLLAFNVRHFERMEREFARVTAQGNRGGARRVP